MQPPTPSNDPPGDNPAAFPTPEPISSSAQIPDTHAPSPFSAASTIATSALGLRTPRATWESDDGESPRAAVRAAAANITPTSGGGSGGSSPQLRLHLSASAAAAAASLIPGSPAAASPRLADVTAATAAGSFVSPSPRRGFASLGGARRGSGSAFSFASPRVHAVGPSAAVAAAVTSHPSPSPDAVPAVGVVLEPGQLQHQHASSSPQHPKPHASSLPLPLPPMEATLTASPHQHHRHDTPQSPPSNPHQPRRLSLGAAGGAHSSSDSNHSRRQHHHNHLYNMGGSSSRSMGGGGGSSRSTGTSGPPSSSSSPRAPRVSTHFSMHALTATAAAALTPPPPSAAAPAGATAPTGNLGNCGPQEPLPSAELPYRDRSRTSSGGSAVELPPPPPPLEVVISPRQSARSAMAAATAAANSMSAAAAAAMAVPELPPQRQQVFRSSSPGDSSSRLHVLRPPRPPPLSHSVSVGGALAANLAAATVAASPDLPAAALTLRRPLPPLPSSLVPPPLLPSPGTSTDNTRTPTADGDEGCGADIHDQRPAGDAALPGAGAAADGSSSPSAEGGPSAKLPKHAQQQQAHGGGDVVPSPQPLAAEAPATPPPTAAPAAAAASLTAASPPSLAQRDDAAAARERSLSADAATASAADGGRVRTVALGSAPSIVTGAAVGVPVMLLQPSAAVTVMGRPAADAAAATGVTQHHQDAHGPADLVVRSAGSALLATNPGVDIVATISATAGGGGAAVRRRRGTTSGGDDDVGTDDEGGGPCALPSEVRRRLRSHLGRHRAKRIRTWKDLSISVANLRSGYWLLFSMLLLAALLGGFLFMAGQYQWVQAAGLAGGSSSGGSDSNSSSSGSSSGSGSSNVTSGNSGSTSSGSSTSIGSSNSGSYSSFGSPPGAWSPATSTSFFSTSPPSPSPPSPSPPSPTSPTSSSPPAWGPSSLSSWLAFWRPRTARTFSFEYLRAWGGRYGPDLAAGQWWRWGSSLLLHQSPLHLASNLALLLVLCTYLESLYGGWRVLPLWVVAGVAGNMASALFESPCTLVVGSSGCVFGLLGAYLADAGTNWESIPLLWLRLGGMGTVVGLMVALQVTDGGVRHGGSISHASHVGGFLAGGLLAALVIPDFKARRSEKVRELLTNLGLQSHMPPMDSPAGRQLYSFWQRHRLLRYGLYGIAVVVLLLELIAVPLYVYFRTFKDLSCD
ncbi:hypothetical protein Agub_g2733 [Astrephomene gubernaculifera]|uniref:RHOMBOID-like protein n=1 Tax=Astrephomene gubernaculifera TaxID=47775 RepID=A0AAD3DHI6_9CHLO|nr:hypothetical protein Agub_g2733 [Astrephomene gubernaculifera]